MAKRSARRTSAPERRVMHNWPPTIVVDSETVFSIAILPNYNQVITGSENKILALWDLNKGTLVRQMKGHTAHILAVAVTPDEKVAISAAFDDTMRVWDIASGRELLRLEFPAAIKSIAVLPNGRTVLVGSNDHLLSLCDIISGQVIRSLTGHTGNVQAVALLPDGNRAISGASDSTMRLWDLRSGTEIKRFAHPGDTVWSVAVHPDGRRAVSLAGGIARLWDLNSGGVLNEFHAGHHHAVAIKDQNLLLTGGRGSAILLWNLESGVQLRRFEGHVEGVRDLAVLPDGRRMLSASDDGSIRLWEIEPSARLGDDVGYTTARIALLGDSGVGKTGLGWRIAHGEFRPQSSTHGQQFWVIDRLSDERDDGTRCEVVLWDLAGQPDYRLIHALF
jgi:WD40 repeat protein